MTPLPWQEAIFYRAQCFLGLHCRPVTDLVVFLDPMGLKWLNKVELTFWVQKWKPEVERLEQGRQDCFLSSRTCAWVHRAAETTRTWSTAVHAVTVRTFFYWRVSERWYYCGETTLATTANFSSWLPVWEAWRDQNESRESRPKEPLQPFWDRNITSWCEILPVWVDVNLNNREMFATTVI